MPRTEDAGVTVQVDESGWERVASLAESGPNDAHFVVVSDESGRTTVHFGDGQRGRRLPEGSRVRVRYSRGSRYAEVVMQDGRVSFDADFDEDRERTARFGGIHRAYVVSSVDPMMRGRLNVIVAGAGQDPIWADPCRPATPDTAASLPAPGDGVWILFEEADPRRPVWIGRT